MIYRKKRFVKRKKINSEKTDLRLRKKSTRKMLRAVFSAVKMFE